MTSSKWNQFVNRWKYSKLDSFYQKKDFERTIVLCDQRLQKGDKSKYVHIILLDSLLSTRTKNNKKRAKILVHNVIDNYPVDVDEMVYFSSKFYEVSELQYTWDLLEKCIALFPEEAKPYRYRAEINLFMSRYEKTIDDYNRVIELAPRDVTSISNRGLSKMKTGDIVNGCQDIMFALKMDADNTICTRNMGVYYFEIGEYTNATSYLKKSLARNPGCLVSISHLQLIKESKE